MLNKEWTETSPDLNTDSMLSIGRIVRIARFVSEYTEELVESHGVSRAEFEILGKLRGMTRSSRATDLSQMTKASGAAITKRLDKLSSMGLVVREALPRDRRVVLVSLTDEGKRVADEIMPLVIEAERAWLEVLEAEEISVLEGILEKLIRALEPARYR